MSKNKIDTNILSFNERNGQEYSIVSINSNVSLLNNFINKRVVRNFQIEIYEIIWIYKSTRVQCSLMNKINFFFIIAHTLYTYTRENIDSFHDKGAFYALRS